MKFLERPGTLPGDSGLNSRITISLSLYTYIYISVYMFIIIYVCTHKTSGDSLKNKLLQGEPRHRCSSPSSAKMMHHRIFVASLRAESPRVISACCRKLWGLKHLVRDLLGVPRGASQVLYVLAGLLDGGRSVQC